jgi:hypothetical protein
MDDSLRSRSLRAGLSGLPRRLHPWRFPATRSAKPSPATSTPATSPRQPHNLPPRARARPGGGRRRGRRRRVERAGLTALAPAFSARAAQGLPLGRSSAPEPGGSASPTGSPLVCRPWQRLSRRAREGTSARRSSSRATFRSRRPATMGPRLSSRGDDGDAAGVRVRDPAAMGLRLSSRRDPDAGWPQRCVVQAAMGPRHSSRGDADSRVGALALTQPQWGPRLPSCGDLNTQIALVAPWATPQWGHGPPAVETRQDQVGALGLRPAMEPRLSSRGDYHHHQRDHRSAAPAMGSRPSSRGDTGINSARKPFPLSLKCGHGVPAVEIRTGRR